MNTIKFNSAVCANKGKVRSNNEDNFYFNGKLLNSQTRDIPAAFSGESDENVLLYGVFDGMGGEAMGEEASLCCARAMKECHQKLKSTTDLRIQNTVLASVKEANLKICQKILESGERRIGTTFAALCINDDKARIFNVGDSRVYMLRKGKLSQISIDDTAAQRLVNMGMITPDEANSHPDKHKLTQHLGIFEDELIIEPHIITDIEICKGDKFLLCSDGLTDMVSDDRIEAVLKSGNDSEKIAGKLVEEALANGGVDNVTAMVVCALSNSQLRKSGSSSKKIFAFLAALIVLIGAGVFAWFEFGDKSPGVSVGIQADDTVFTVGETGSFTATRSAGKQVDIFRFESSDEKVIKITDSKIGSFEAVAPGKAVVTVKYSDASDSVEITVKEASEKSGKRDKEK